MADACGTFRPAALSDLEALVRLQREYYREDGYAHRHTEARLAWQQLLADRTRGLVWLARSDKGCSGYLVVTLGFSLEYLGIDAFVDELYVVPVMRGRGLGRRALALAERACRELGVKALHLEVEPDKSRALDLYRRAGFLDHHRRLMTKRLE